MNDELVKNALTRRGVPVRRVVSTVVSTHNSDRMAMILKTKFLSLLLNLREVANVVCIDLDLEPGRMTNISLRPCLGAASLEKDTRVVWWGM